jgi:hypothetical protein
MRKNFRPLPNYSLFSEYIRKTNNKFYNSIKKDCENYTFKKNMRSLIDIDNDNIDNIDNDDNNIDNNIDKNNDCSIIKCYNDGTCGFTLFTLTTFTIGIYTFLYFYRFKK